ncbi:MAG: chemotaxis protein CheA [Leptospirales bacterium]|nr:chemotaxis protein CheA [Leptospirales bacterium]
MMRDYLAEMREQMDRIERAVLQMEAQGSSTGTVDPNTINSIFRAFHSIKGTSGFFEFKKIVSIAHQAETLLAQIRSGEMAFKNEMSDAFVQACDCIRNLVDSVEASGAESGHEEFAARVIEGFKKFSPIIEPVAQGVSWGLFPKKAKAAPPKRNPDLTPAMLSHFVSSTGQSINRICEDLRASSNGEASRKILSDLEALAEGCQVLGLEQTQRFFLKCQSFLSEAPTPDRNTVLASVLSRANASLAQLPDESSLDALMQALVLPNKTPETENQSREFESGFRSERQDIRIATSKLDSMMNLVGELVVAEALVTQHKDLIGHVGPGFLSAARHLGKIVRSMQEVALSMRMVPLSSVFQRINRLVRDLSNKSGKKVRLSIHGEETEVDKTIAELIVDPLVHIMRNAVDHGIEKSEERLRVGKNETGEITLTALYSGNEVHIVIEDDGGGLSRERIIKRAVAQGLIADGQELRDDEVWELIFRPGFSTAETVTDISGRGVGMDVVRRNISSLSGRIDVQVKPGRGTRFILRIPLTLAIIEGLIARIGGVHFVVPMMDSTQSLRHSAVGMTRMTDGGTLAQYRDQFFPVVSLAELLKIPQARETITEKSLIVQVKHSGKTIGVIVDELLGNQHIVVKPMGGLVAKTPGVSGCTVMGDGGVALILDVGHIAQLVSYDEVPREANRQVVGSGVHI